jgi:hypothetical protein
MREAHLGHGRPNRLQTNNRIMGPNLNHNEMCCSCLDIIPSLHKSITKETDAYMFRSQYLTQKCFAV